MAFSCWPRYLSILFSAPARSARCLFIYFSSFLEQSELAGTALLLLFFNLARPGETNRYRICSMIYGGWLGDSFIWIKDDDHQIVFMVPMNNLLGHRLCSGYLTTGRVSSLIILHIILKIKQFADVRSINISTQVGCRLNIPAICLYPTL